MTLTGYMCPRCKEPLGSCVIPSPGSSWSGEFSVVVLPKRLTRCKKYKPGQGGRICKGCGETSVEALGQWKDPDGRGPVLES